MFMNVFFKLYIILYIIYKRNNITLTNRVKHLYFYQSTLVILRHNILTRESINGDRLILCIFI